MWAEISSRGAPFPEMEEKVRSLWAARQAFGRRKPEAAGRTFDDLRYGALVSGRVR